jgi:hypothetical protein
MRDSDVFHVQFAKLNRYALIAATVMLSACVGPGPGAGPDRPGEGRGGPPPFSSLDLNGDGEVTLDEFKSHDIPRGDHTEVFNSIDTDADGVLTQSEFSGHRPPSPPSSSQ